MEGNPYASNPRDVELEHEVGEHLRNMGVEHSHVSVQGGHVTVSGTVDDFGTKREVTQRIHTLGGITQLTNNIRVNGDFSMHYGGDRSL